MFQALKPNSEIELPHKNAKRTKRKAADYLCRTFFVVHRLSSSGRQALRSFRSLAANFGFQIKPPICADGKSLRR